ncbi:hypothetical protein ACWGJ9_09760 [Curtobacterium citreum]
MTAKQTPCGATFGTAISAGHGCNCVRTTPHTADGTLTEAHGCPCGNWWPQPADLTRQQETIR